VRWELRVRGLSASGMGSMHSDKNKLRQIKRLDPFLQNNTALEPVRE